MSLGPDKAIFRFLDTNGDGTGTKNANGNYASVADEFYFESTESTQIHRMVIHITDTAGITQIKYGNLAALTNGYTVKVLDADQVEVLDLCDDVAIKANADLGRYCYDVQLQSWATSPTNESVEARWTFARAGQPLDLPIGWRLSITFNDDLSGLIEHYFMIQGYVG